MSLTASLTVPIPRRWDEFLKALTEKLSKPTPSLPNVRCLKRNTLIRGFNSIKKGLSLPTTFPSGSSIISLLAAMGLLIPIPVKTRFGGEIADEFFTYGVPEFDSSSVDPLELLQAISPTGIICYFSALSRLELITQIASHHHVAIPTHRLSSYLPMNHPNEKGRTNKGPSTNRSRLGTASFYYDGIPFYTTKRLSDNIPGTTLTMLSPRVNIRVTNLEQTLLDTLQFPIHCGGSETVFEAWKSGLEMIDEAVIIDYLKRINIRPLTRRFATILDLFGIQPTSALKDYLLSSKELYLQTDDFHLIPLLRGLEFPNLHEEWNIQIP